MRHLIITLKKAVSWREYKQELEAVKDGHAVLNFRIPSVPKDSGPGMRCYLVHDGLIKGWMVISDIRKREGFRCGTTGLWWPEGVYVQRTGPFVYLKTPVPYKSFQGYHYFDEAYLGEQAPKLASDYTITPAVRSGYLMKSASDKYGITVADTGSVEQTVAAFVKAYLDLENR